MMLMTVSTCQTQSDSDIEESGLSKKTLAKLNVVADSMLDRIRDKDPEGYERAMKIYEEQYARNGNGNNGSNGRSKSCGGSEHVGRRGRKDTGAKNN